MAYTEHGIANINVLGDIVCTCDTIRSPDKYATHVAAAIVQGLTERCSEAEEKLEQQAAAKADPWVTKDSASEYDRLTGKKAGVALARSYIEEVLR